MASDDFMKNGKPKVKPLNKALSDAGFNEIDGDTRDQLMNEVEAEETEPDPFEGVDVPKGCTAVLVGDASPQSPVILATRGRTCKLRVGRVEIIPNTHLDALRRSNVPFSMKED